MFRPISPVPVNCRARALPFAHEKETAPSTPVRFLWRLVQRQVSLVARYAALDEVDSVLVGTAAVASFTVSLNPPNSVSCVRIACVPYASCRIVFSEQHSSHIDKKVEG